MTAWPLNLSVPFAALCVGSSHRTPGVVGKPLDALLWLTTVRVPVVRVAVCSLAAALAKQLVPANQWPELFAFITQCMQPTSTAVHRELGMLLLRDLLEIVGNHLKSAFESLRQMMLAALSDSEERVRCVPAWHTRRPVAASVTASHVHAMPAGMLPCEPSPWS